MLRKLNYHFYRFKYRFGKYLPLVNPVDCTLELAAQCNQRCSYCYFADPKKVPFTTGIMKPDLAFKIIDQAAEMGVHSLKFNHRGEPTLNPHFKEITSYAKLLANGSTFIDRITNSNFKFKKNKEQIFDGLCNQTKVKVSFDSFDPTVFQKQRVGGNWQITYNNINEFYNYPGRDNELVIQAVRTTLNKDEDIEGKVKKLWPSAIVSVRDLVSGRTDNLDKEMLNKERDLNYRQSCVQAHVRLIVHHDGKVAPCCPDIKGKLILGDANIMSLKKIFNSHMAKQLRRDLKDKTAFSLDPCKTCPSYESYKGFKPRWNA